MKASDGDQADPCPCNKSCSDYTSGVEENVQLRNAVLETHSHVENSEVNKDTGNVRIATTDASVDNLIVHNAKHMDYLSESDLREITCPRCREILNRALKLLRTVPALVNKNDITSICDHCKFKQQPHDYNKVIKRFDTTSKNESKESSKQPVKKWLSKFNKTDDDKRERTKKLNRTCSESRIGQLLNKESTRSERDFVITELFCELEKSELTETRSHPTDKNKNRIGFKLDSPDLAHQPLTIVDPSGKIIQLPIPIKILLDSKEQFYPSDLDNISGISMSAPGTTRDYFEVEQITKERQRALRESSLPSQSKNKKESVKDHINIKRHSVLPKSQDDIFSAIDSRKYVHDKETDPKYNKKAKDKYFIQNRERDQSLERKAHNQQNNISRPGKKLSHHFSFCFPQKIQLDEKLKRVKSSSELIRDIQAKITANTKREKDIQEKEMKLISEVKPKVVDEQKGLSKLKKIAGEEGKLNEDEEQAKLHREKSTLSTSTSKHETKEHKQKSVQNTSKSDVKEPKISKEALKSLIDKEEHEKILPKENKQQQKEMKQRLKKYDKIDHKEIKEGKQSFKTAIARKEGMKDEKIEFDRKSRNDIEQKKQDNLLGPHNAKVQKSKKEDLLDTLTHEHKIEREARKNQDKSTKETKSKHIDLAQLPNEKAKIDSREATADKKLRPEKGENGQRTNEKRIEETGRKDQRKGLEQTQYSMKKDITEKKLDKHISKAEDTVKEGRGNNERVELKQKHKLIDQEQTENGKQETDIRDRSDLKNYKHGKAKEGHVPKIRDVQSAKESNLEYEKSKIKPKTDPPAIDDLNKIKMLASSQGTIVAKLSARQKELQSNLKGNIDTKGLEYMLKQKQARGLEESKKAPKSIEVKRSLEDSKKAGKEIEAKMRADAPSVKKTKQTEINIEGIKLLRPSQDYFVLELVKLKKSHKNNILLSEIMTPLEIEEHKKSHKPFKEEKCFMCINSDVELEYEIRKLKSKSIHDIIKGQKLFKCKHPHTDKTVTEELAPLLFKKKYDELLTPVIKAAEIPVAVSAEEKLTPKPTGKLPKSLAETEVETKGIIRYALSDRSFIEKGWTMLPTEKVVRKMNVYRMRPAHPEFDWFEHNKNKGSMNYDSGERLAEFDNNGRGRWYYRNGRLALDYYDAEELNAQQRFVIYSTGQPDERGRSQPYTIIAAFDHLGNGIVFDHSGKIRLKYNQTEGIVLDRSIGPVSHWKWHTLNDPPVLQQVMIDTQMAHKDPDILKMGGPLDGKTRPENEEMLAIEFENFIKEKSKKLSQSFKPFQIKMKALKINEHFSLKVLDQATIYVIFRDGTTNLKLNIGMILDHKEIVDTDTAEVGEVSNSLERFPARTDSLAALQKSVAYAQRFERNRMERERRLCRPEPRASADKLTAAASRPMQQLFHSVHSATTGSTNCYCNRKLASNNIYYDNRLL